MEFLVRFEINAPESMSTDERERLRVIERARAMELREQGILKRLWRVPGRRAVVPCANVLMPLNFTTL